MDENLIYKYYAPTEYSLDALINRYFWFSKRSALNDPYDMNIQVLEVFPKFKELLEHYGYNLEQYKQILENFAICCFTKRPDNKHFWSLYAGSFQGWCLEFEEDNLIDSQIGVPNQLYDVIYLDAVPDLNDKYQHLELEKHEDGTISETIAGLLSYEKGHEKLFTYLLRIKNREVWGVEEEKRLILGNIYLMNHKINCDTRGYGIPWKINALKRIIVGYKISDCMRKKITLIANEMGVPMAEAKPNLQDRNFIVEVKSI